MRLLPIRVWPIAAPIASTISLNPGPLPQPARPVKNKSRADFDIPRPGFGSGIWAARRPARASRPARSATSFARVSRMPDDHTLHLRRRCRLHSSFAPAVPLTARSGAGRQIDFAPAADVRALAVGRTEITGLSKARTCWRRRRRCAYGADQPKEDVAAGRRGWLGGLAEPRRDRFGNSGTRPAPFGISRPTR